MTDLQQMSRILYHHNWLRVEDWARNIERLADLSDEEIGQLPGCAAAATTASLRCPKSRRRARQHRIAMLGS